MPWDVEFTDEFETWWEGLAEEEQEKIRAAVKLLQDFGPNLGFPLSSAAKSKYSHMRELRVQIQGNPFRILYAFDPRRVAILLLGGDKTGDDRWYEVNIPKAEKIYGDLLADLAREDIEAGGKKGTADG